VGNGREAVGYLQGESVVSRIARSTRDLKLTWPSKPTEVHAEPADLQLARIVTPPAARPAVTRNRLIEGDNLSVMAALLPEWRGRVDLLYADPPFMTGKRFAARIGRGEDSRKPDEWLLDEGYDDRWADPDTYLTMMYKRLWLMRELLSERGTLYLHADWHASHYLRLLLDELFGAEHMLNEIAWVYHGPSPVRRAFNRKHDTLLVYTRSDDYTFNADAVRVPYDNTTVKTFNSSRKAGFGKVPDLARGKVPEDWWYFPVVARLHGERTGYPTQKPEALIERIVRASSNAGDVVADFFCGSGTLPVVAERWGRRWVACDASPRAIHTTAKRLLDGAACAPFEVWRVGEERQADEHMQVTSSIDGRQLQVTLDEYEADVPEDIRERIRDFRDLVDYWEIDPDHRDGIFHSRWQSFRSRARPQLETRATFQLDERKRRQVVVRLVDVLGRVSFLSLDTP
jgi:site-specific DNA-methyltransferase (adenine-specific)